MRGLSLLAARGGNAVAMARGLLSAVISLVMEHGLSAYASVAAALSL